MRLLAVRHGAIATSGVELPARDGREPLSPAGVEEAGALARLLADQDIAEVFSSPALRAIETARAVAGVHGLEPVIAGDLIEIDMGDWAGRSLEWAREQPTWETFRTDPVRFAFPGGESFAALTERTGVLLDRICRAYADRTVVLVAHRGNVMAILAALKGGVDGSVEIPTASVTDFAIDGDTVTVGTIGRR